jgi:hypothetical protein
MDIVLFLSNEDTSKVVIVRKHVPENGHSLWKNTDIGGSDIR